MATIKEQFETGLTASGEQRTALQPSRKLVRWSARAILGPKSDGTERYFWLGRAGALRIGRCATETFPASDRLKAAIVQAGQVAQRAESPQASLSLGDL